MSLESLSDNIKNSANVKQDLMTLENKFVQLSKLFYEISALWEKNSGRENDLLEGDAFSTKYPFRQSFDELANEVSGWVEECKLEINKAIQKNKRIPIKLTSRGKQNLAPAHNN